MEVMAGRRMNWKTGEIIAVSGLVIWGAWLRLYHLRETLIFQGDQGRDAMIAAEMLTQGNLTLIGPVTSVGNMYLGPFYYYFMVPFLALTYPDPIGPAYGVALANIAALVVIYLMAKEMFSRTTALISLGLLTFTLPVVYLSRFSWNPNLAPLVGLLLVWSLYRFWVNLDYRQLLISGLLLSILSQLHYLALIMLPVTVMVYGISFRQNPTARGQLTRYGLIALVIYLLSWLPLIIFNSRHDQLILSGFEQFLANRETHFVPQGSMVKTIQEIEGKSYHLIARTLGSLTPLTDRIIVWGGSFLLIGLLITHPLKGKPAKGLQLIGLTLGLTLAGIAIFTGDIFNHYLGYAYGAVILLWGWILGRLWQITGWGGKVVTLVIIVVIGFWSVPRLATWAAPAPSLNGVKAVAQDIAAQLPPGKFNLALLAESKDYKGMNYRYFLTTLKAVPASPEDYEQLNYLVVIDELGLTDPTAVSIYEIQHPGRLKLYNQFNSQFGPKIWLYQVEPATASANLNL
ncbi:hypothetical protein A2W24_00875 [Microgenomates group bacterium RBG_16_45_19]|nr:MAG: hypothetical protein A2W24_00875 [Microgenomates group bacterium RBG_16_45_19]